MSKPSDKDLERDGIHCWLGKTRKEIAQRVRVRDEGLHEDMLARLVEGTLVLPRGRPKGQKSGTTSWAETVRQEFQKLREAGMKPTEAMERLAAKYGRHYDTIQNAVRRSAHK